MTAALMAPPGPRIADVSVPSVGAWGTDTELPSCPLVTVLVPNTPLNSPVLGATCAIQTSTGFPPVITMRRFCADDDPRALADWTPPTQPEDVALSTQR